MTSPLPRDAAVAALRSPLRQQAGSPAPRAGSGVSRCGLLSLLGIVAALDPEAAFDPPGLRYAAPASGLAPGILFVTLGTGMSRLADRSAGHLMAWLRQLLRSE
jgi:hypothetical protein